MPLAAAVATVGATILFLATDFESGLRRLAHPLWRPVRDRADTRRADARDARPERRGRYGEVRAFGSLAFVVSTVAVGLLLDAEGARSLFWVYLPFLVGDGPRDRDDPAARARPVRSACCAAPASSSPRRASLCSFVGFTVVWASLAAVNAFYSIQVVALGGSPALVGIAWAFGAAIEVPLMYAFPRLAGRFGTERLVVFGSLAFALRACWRRLPPIRWRSC